MQRFKATALIWLILSFICILPAYCAPDKAKTATANIAATDTAVSLGGTFSNVVIYTSSTAPTIYIDINDATATTADTPLAAGGVYRYTNGEGISSFHYYAAAATGTITFVASNAEITYTPPGGSGGGAGSAVYGADGATAMSATNPFVVSDDASANSAANPMHFQPSIAGAANSATNGLYFNNLQGNAVISAANPLFHANSIGGAVVSATNGLFSNLLQGNAVISAANPIFSQRSIAGAVTSATNGDYNNLLQGNAVLSATNGIFANVLKGNAAISAANPLQTQVIVNGTAVAAANPIPVSATEAANTAANPIHAQIAVAGTTVGTANPVPVSATTGANAVGNTIFVSPVQAGAAVGVGNPLYIQGSVTTSGTTANQTFSATCDFTTPAASLTDFWEIFGSGTKTIYVTKILIGITASSFSTNPWNELTLLRRTSANSGGTSTTITGNEYDTNNSSPTATVKVYTSNPTTGGAGTNVVKKRLYLVQAGPPREMECVMFDSTAAGTQPLVLRGTAEGFVINGGGTSQDGTGIKYNVTVEWYEV